MELNVLFSLPKEIPIMVIKDWLGSLRDLAKLDIACTNGIRKRYMDIVNDPMFMLHLNDIHEINNLAGYAQWLNHRRIRIQRIFVPIESLHDMALISYELLRTVDHMFLLGSARIIEPEELTGFLNLFRNLTNLNCTICDDISDATLSAIAAISPVIQLQTLNLTYSNEPTNAGMRIITERFGATLETLRIGSECINDTALHQVASACKRLTKVGFVCLRMTAAGLLSFFASYTRMDAICLEEAGNVVTDGLIIGIAQRSPLLTGLELLYCFQISCESMAPILRACPRMLNLDAKHAYLYKFEDGNCHVFLSPPMRTDARLLFDAMHASSRPVTSVHFQGELTDTTLRQLADQADSNLTTLRTELDHTVTDDTIIHVVSRCPMLMVLDLRQCWNLTDRSILAVAKNCPHLNTLGINNARKVTDSALLVVVRQYGKQLTHLYMGGCSSITDATVNEIASHCPSLRYLELCGTTISAEAVLHLVIEDCLQCLKTCTVDKKLQAAINRLLKSIGVALNRWKSCIEFSSN